MLPFRWLTLPRLIMAITFVAIFVIAFRAPLDTDTYWHLRAGQWQVEHGAWMFKDEFSSTRIGQAWINLYWLAQALMYGIYSALGDSGLALFTAAVATAGMAFILPLLVGDWLQRAFVMILAAAASALFWSPRPQMISFLLSAIVVRLLWLFLKQRQDRLWLVPALMIVWANMHPGFALAFILIALAMVGETARWLIHQFAPNSATVVDAPTLRPVLRLGLIALVSAAAVLINPYGLDTLLHPFRTIEIGVLRDFIQEWASPNFHEPRTWPFALLMLGTLLGAAMSSRRLDIGDGVMLAGTAVSALLAARNIPTFAIVAAPILSLHLESWLSDRGVRLNSARLPVRGLFLAANWLILLLVLLGGMVKMASEFTPARFNAARAEIFPLAAIDHLKQTAPPRELFNSYNWGGYLMWAARDYPVFVDGRTDLYDDAFVREYLNIVYAQPGWDAALDAHRINVVLIESNSPLAQVLALTGGWTRTFMDDQAVVFLRDNPLR